MKWLWPFAALLVGCSSGPKGLSARLTVLDLTHTLAADIPIYPGGVPLSLERKADLEEHGYYLNAFTVGEHTGTHLDAPIHFVAGGDSVDEIPAERLIGPGAVIDISDACAADTDYRLSYMDIKRWESRHGRIPNGAIVLVRTGWDRRWSDA